MDPTLDSRIELQMPESHCFKLNIKSWQLNTTHQCSIIMFVERKKHYNLVLLSLFDLLQGTSKLLETNCNHLIDFNALDANVSNSVTCFNQTPIFEWYVIRYGSTK